VLTSIIYRAENMLKPRNHSSSQYPTDRRYVSSVYQLGVKLYQERQGFIECMEAQKLQLHQKSNASRICQFSCSLYFHFWYSLKSFHSLSSVASPYSSGNKKVHNNQQEALFEIDDVGNEMKGNKH